MTDTTVKKVAASTSPKGSMGQKYLVSGKQVSMRLWSKTKDQDSKPESIRAYETVGYVIDGKAELVLEGQTLILSPGDSWLVPKDARHSYRILEAFEAIEATSPPAHVHDRDSTG